MNSCWRKLRGRVVDSLTRALLPFWPLRASRLQQSSRRRVSTIAGHAPRAHRQPLQRLLQLQLQLLLGRTILLTLQQCKPSCGGLAKPPWIGKSSRRKPRHRHRRRRRHSSKSSRASTPQGLAQDLETISGIL